MVDSDVEKMTSLFLDSVKPLQLPKNIQFPYSRSLYFLQQKARLLTKNPYLKIRKCIGYWAILAENPPIIGCKLNAHILGEKFWMRDGLIVSEAEDRALIQDLLSDYHLCSIDLKTKKLDFNVTLTAFTLEI